MTLEPGTTKLADRGRVPPRAVAPLGTIRDAIGGVIGTAVLCTIAGVAPGCGRSDPAPPPAASSPNLLLVAVDTLRADHLGAYGYARETSPAIDRFFRSAVVFEEAWSSSSWTLPAFASLMTSLYPSTHGCWQLDHALDPSFTTLAERLSAAGYDTAAVVSHTLLGEKHGMRQGFASWDESVVASLSVSESDKVVSSPHVTRAALEFLRRQADGPRERPWFLWVHYFDPHERYLAHEGFGERFGADEPVDRYDGEIAFTDAHVGRLLERLEQWGLARDTIVVFVADHGEEFGDHGGTGHGHSLFAEVGRVPFAIRAPGLEPARVARPVSLVDFLPTVLELAGLPPGEAPVAGRSLVGSMHAETGPGEPDARRGVLLESRLDQLPNASLEAYVSGKWKLLVVTPRRALAGEPPLVTLFDRERDPRELVNVAARRHEVAAGLRRELRAAVEDAARLATRFDAGREVELDAEELERLEALGYGGERRGDAPPRSR